MSWRNEDFPGCDRFIYTEPHEDQAAELRRRMAEREPDETDAERIRRRLKPPVTVDVDTLAGIENL